MRVRRTEADVNLLFTWLKLDGEITIVENEPVASRDAHLEHKVEPLEPVR